MVVSSRFVLMSLLLLHAHAYGEEAGNGLSVLESKNLEVVQLWNDQVWTKGRLDLVDKLVTPTYTRHESGETRIVTREAYAEEIRQNRERGTRFKFNAIAADDDLVWTRWSANSSLLGIGIEFHGIQIYRLQEGQLTETWLIMDMGDHWPDN